MGTHRGFANAIVIGPAMVLPGVVCTRIAGIVAILGPPTRIERVRANGWVQDTWIPGAPGSRVSSRLTLAVDTDGIVRSWN